MNPSQNIPEAKGKEAFHLLLKRNLTLIGYGNQGRAQALNLRDSGLKNLVIGLRETSPHAQTAREDGIQTLPLEEAIAWADVVVLLIPDEQQPAFYRTYLDPYLKQNSALIFAHGFAIHFGLITPPPHVDVLMVTPKGTGYGLRKAYEEHTSFPCLWAVAHDSSGDGKALTLAYAHAVAGTHVYTVETTFHEECVANIFNEHAMIGGLSGLIQTSFDTMVNSGISPQIAYLESMNGLKIIATLLYERGITGLNEAISNTAEYASYKGQKHLITEETETAMAHLMNTIKEGDFAKQWMDDHACGQKGLLAARSALSQHRIEEVGSHVRFSLSAPKDSCMEATP